MTKSKKIAASPADAARTAKMYWICQIDRVGEIEGVEFDFRSDLLPPSEWQTIPLRARLEELRDPHQPFIWFPWFGAFDKACLRQDAEAHLSSAGQEPAKAEIERSVSVRKPDAIVHRGDKICIERVDIERDDVPFEHAHDIEVRRAHLCIHRENGDLESIAVPLEFTGAFALMGPGARSETLETVRDRILERFKLEALDGDVTGSGEPAFALEALRLARLLEAHTRHLRDLAGGIPLLPDGKPDRPNERLAAMEAMHLVDASVRLGYFWAKAEAERDMKPMAKRALRSRAGASRGGTNSGESRRKGRAETWEPRALRLARDFRIKNPSASQDMVVDEIKSLWPSAPGRTTLKAFISRMERAGELAPRIQSAKGH